MAKLFVVVQHWFNNKHMVIARNLEKNTLWLWFSCESTVCQNQSGTHYRKPWLLLHFSDELIKQILKYSGNVPVLVTQTCPVRQAEQLTADN